MPVPRLFEGASDPRAQWVHLVATLLALGGAQTRTALVHELSGEELPGADALLVREERPLGAASLRGDIVARGAGWTLVIQATLAFDADEGPRLAATRAALEDAKDRTILVALTPDRRPPAALAGPGADVTYHRSWLRVRDWVQERPERAGATGPELLLLREAEYFLTPRVAELYRLEALMPKLPPALRPTFAEIFFDLNELAPAPLVQVGADVTRVAFPRTGEPAAEVLLQGGGIRLRLRAEAPGPGFGADGDGWQALGVSAPEDYLAARAWTQATARAVLPTRL